MSDVDRTVWVGNLSDKVTEEILFELFLQAGPLEKMKIATDKDGRLKSFAFITFKHACSVPFTIDLMSGIQLYGYSLKLQARTGSSHSSPNPYNQQSPAQVGVSNSPQYSGSTSPMTRANTWHGKDQRYGRQNSDNSYNMRQSPRDGDRHNYGSNQSPRDNDMLPAQGQFHDSNAQNMDPLSMQIRREKILQQQRTTLDTHRQRNYPPQNPYGNRPPWQQHQRSYNRRY